MTHPGYHDMKRGMMFEEVAGKRRRVQVTHSGIYHALVAWTSPRGIPRNMQVPNKRLADPAVWRYLGNPGESDGR